MLKISFEDRPIWFWVSVIIVANGMLLLSGYYLFLNQTINELKIIKTTQQKLNDQIKHSKSKQESIQKFGKEIQLLQNTYSQLITQFQSQLSINNAMSQLTMDLQNSLLQLHAIKPLKKFPATFFLDAEGSYPNSLKFLHSLSTHDCLFKITKLRFLLRSPNHRAEPVISLQIEIELIKGEIA